MGLLDWLGITSTASVGALPAEAPLPPAPTPDDITLALDQVDQLLLEQTLTAAIIARAQRVTARLRDTVPRMDNSGLTSTDQYALIATATSYLPEALSSYLRLPRDWANARPIVGGKTALLILIDQLDLLSATVDKMYDAVLQRDARALIEHGRFLQERFAPGNPTPAGPVPPTTVERSHNPLDLEAL